MRGQGICFAQFRRGLLLTASGERAKLSSRKPSDPKVNMRIKKNYTGPGEAVQQ